MKIPINNINKTIGKDKQFKIISSISFNYLKHNCPNSTNYPYSSLMAYQKCKKCKRRSGQVALNLLKCKKHYLCDVCASQPDEFIQCSQCLQQPRNKPKTYPVQGIMMNYDKNFNPKGQSQFSSRKNCYQRTSGWMMCNILAIVFLFSGLAVAIKTSELATGVILCILGVVGIITSIYFMRKIRNVDLCYSSERYINQSGSIQNEIQ